MSSKVDDDIDQDDIININFDFKKSENKKEISKILVYNFDFRLTDLFY